MTPRQIALVQASWKLVQPIADKAAELFYNRLFSLEPSVRRLFTGDMTEQGRKLMSMISVAVNSLARLQSIAPAVQALGRRHAGYGVQKHHYAVVEAALIWTLAQGLDEKFTRETEEAWRTAYRVLANTMQSNTEEKIHASQPAVS
jgi:hemoglobin-like flavoprotein